MPLDAFHPAVAAWFRGTFPAPTEAQTRAWPAIAAGEDVLVAAPTGSGKTLTAFLAAIDALVREGLDGGLQDAVSVVYVSPLKALSNDVRLNLEQPLAGIRAELARLGLPDVDIRSAVRTGDTPQSERAKAARRPPQVMVTTPESLYVLLGSDSGRRMLAGARTVIVDEIHAVAGDKRGSHLALTLARLDDLRGRRLQRIGLSATQKPIDAVARFLTGAGADGEVLPCTIVETGAHARRDLALELPDAPLGPVFSNDQASQQYARIATFAQHHRTTLVFVNTRRMAERAARHLGELLGRDAVAAHHGSLSKDLRLDAEQRLKRGDLRVLVATASLELGIDIGDVDLVCQIGSPGSIAAFLQRAGRAGHHVGGVPKARLFPQSRDDLAECVALLDAIRRGELDAIRMPRAPVDVLAQQLVAEVAAGDRDEDALYALVRRAQPYADLPRADFDAVARMLSDGVTTRHGPRAGLLQRDAVNRRLHARRGAKLTAVSAGGTIPDLADYTVMLEPQALSIGSVHEDFAIESLAGDVFQLGNASYRILKIEPGRLRVEDAKGAAPNIPFWIAEAPGRSDELSASLSRLRTDADARLRDGGEDALRAWLLDDIAIDAEAARQLAAYLARASAILRGLPTQHRVVFERFFDASGGMQLVIHAPFGSRVNRAWGLALRKRFCRSFNFELQAAATEDAIVLSLSTSHSFPLAEVARYLHPHSAREVLVQALLDAPLFGSRWRWNATNALALPRTAGGRRVAPQLQRMKAEDLLAAVFPDQVACLENIAGDREVPDHPLVAQTLEDCLHVAMDADQWLSVLRGIFDGSIVVEAHDLPAPSPLAAEVLNTRPYQFLDDAPLEERRTQAVRAGGFADALDADGFGRLDADAIALVRDEAWPGDVRDAGEMHDALLALGWIDDADLARDRGWAPLLDALAGEGRATRAADAATGARAWIATERLPLLQALWPAAAATPAVAVPAEHAGVAWTREAALLELVRARSGVLGPFAAGALQAGSAEVDAALLALQAEGTVIAGAFEPEAGVAQWCERHLLARIHRYTLQRLRRAVEPVEPRDYVRFLLDWQRLSPATRMRGPDALPAVLAQLEGYEAPAAAWEADLLPARIADYSIAWLDEQCGSGRVAWARLRTAEGGGAPATVRATPLVLLPRRQAATWTRLSTRGDAGARDAAVSAKAQRVLDALARGGAAFFDQLLDDTRLLDPELEDALAECVARGRVHCDSFTGLRALMLPPSKRTPARGRGHGRRRIAMHGLADAGRWALVPGRGAVDDTGTQASTVTMDDARDAGDAARRADADLEHLARTLLRRYGVACWRLLAREAPWLPPWRDLVRVYRRLEARGEIRGGRFIAGLSGEQYALPDAVAALRAVRDRPHDGAITCVSAADPLNLAGLLSGGERIARTPGARIAWRDGVAIAALVAGEVLVLEGVDPAVTVEVERALRREGERQGRGARGEGRSRTKSRRACSCVVPPLTFPSP